jgi:hypothetical protein
MEFSVNPDGLTVTDKATGLTWQKEDDNVRRDWVAAVFYCRNLELAGSSAWHLPNPYELQSIVRYDRVNPAIDVAAFPGTNAEPYWSSSNVANSTDHAWVVYFYNGYVQGLGKTEQGFVRCVR